MDALQTQRDIIYTAIVADIGEALHRLAGLASTMVRLSAGDVRALFNDREILLAAVPSEEPAAEPAAVSELATV